MAKESTSGKKKTQLSIDKAKFESYNLPVDKLGKILDNMIEWGESIDLSKGFSPSELSTVDSIYKNAIKFKEFLENSREVKESSIEAAAAAIRRRREAVLLASKKKIYNEIENDLEFLFYIWQFDIVAFAEDLFGLWQDPNDPRKGLTPQQKDLLLHMEKMAKAKFKYQELDEVFLDEMDKEQAAKLGVAVRSGQGPGKTFVTSILCMWMFVCFPDAQVVCYSPSERQTKQGVWKCFRVLRRMSIQYFETMIDDNGEKLKSPLDEWIDIMEESVIRKGGGKESKIILGRISSSSSATEQGESVSGQHADYQLICLDEASVIEDKVIERLEGTSSDPMNFLVMISNPTRETGYFREVFRVNSNRWALLHWNAEESPRVSKLKLKADEDLYGRDSVEYGIRVLGNFPGTDTRMFIGWDEVQDAIERISVIASPHSRRVLVYDPSTGSGPDTTAYWVIHGNKVLSGGELYGNEMSQVGQVINLCREWNLDQIVYDGNGLGSPIGARLEELQKIHGFDLLKVIAHKKLITRTEYSRVRDMCWGKMQKAFKKGELDLSILEEPKFATIRTKLVSALTKMQAKFDSEGRMTVMSKEDYRKLRYPSPDLADALSFYFYEDQEIYTPYDKSSEWAYEIEDQSSFNSSHSSSSSWMGG